MNDNVFSIPELNWLKENPAVAKHIDESIDDSLNVNPLENGEPDLVPFNRAVIAAQITIEIAQEKMISGPYNGTHWQIISKHIGNSPALENKETLFWELFSFHCACSKEENKRRPKERIYIEAMKEMITAIDENTFQFLESGSNLVANLNTNTFQQIKGTGVNAKFAD